MIVAERINQLLKWNAIVSAKCYVNVKKCPCLLGGELPGQMSVCKTKPSIVQNKSEFSMEKSCYDKRDRKKKQRKNLATKPSIHNSVDCTITSDLENISCIWVA